MDAQSEEPDNELPAGYELEYTALRGEILKRIELRQQFIAITLTFAGVLLGIGVATPSIALLYPPLATFLAIGWAQNDLRVRDIATYIREKLEVFTPELGWESYLEEGGGSTGSRQWRFVIMSHTGIFLFTQGLAVSIGLLNFTFTLLEWVLLGIDLIAMLVVLYIARLARR